MRNRTITTFDIERDCRKTQLYRTARHSLALQAPVSSDFHRPMEGCLSAERRARPREPLYIDKNLYQHLTLSSP